MELSGIKWNQVESDGIADFGFRIADCLPSVASAKEGGLAGAVSEAGVSEPMSSEFPPGDSQIGSVTTAFSD